MKAYSNDAKKDQSQLLVECFMRSMQNDQRKIPTAPTMPGHEIRKLRARLILEEALEVIWALGFQVSTSQVTNVGLGDWKTVISPKTFNKLSFEAAQPPNLVEIVDGLCDLDVVGARGTAAACGVAIAPCIALVNGNNLLKFAPGHSFAPDHKLIKPPDHPPVTLDLRHELHQQGWAGDDITELR